ncbi:MAG: PLP-dependent aminotransferase family protein [Bryobacteraceae bacterium]
MENATGNFASGLGLSLNGQSAVPLYRQIQDHIRERIEAGVLRDGDRLPPTRDLAEALRLNRATVAAAYRALEEEGLLRGHVGRGSFVQSRQFAPTPASDPAWPTEAAISFSTARPSDALFPIADFRRSAHEVLAGDLAPILQLGSPIGYEPFRRHLLEALAASGQAQPADDLIVTSGCQQALDLLQRVLAPAGSTVFVEDPIYPGLRELFRRAGVRLAGIPVGAGGIDIGALDRALHREHPALIVVTPDFQNPTGITLPLEQRDQLLGLAAAHGVPLVENAAYSALRHEGEPVAALKRMDRAGLVIQVGSFSKLAFPGLRIGWIAAPRTIVERAAVAKQWADLHSDQLSQAILHRFLASGRMEAHRRKVIEAGRERLDATIAGLREFFPGGTSFARPEGGMNIWVELPAPADAEEILPKAIAGGVSFLPARYFAVGDFPRGALRLSFAGLAPGEIRRGLQVIGGIAAKAIHGGEASRLPLASAIV